MAEKKQPTAGGLPSRSLQLNLVGLQAADERPSLVVTALDANAKTLHAAAVDDQGKFELPPAALAQAQRIVIGPRAEAGGTIDPATLLTYRPRQFEQLLKNGVLNLAPGLWERWRWHIRCVTGTVKVCRRRPWWYAELQQLATAPLSAVPLAGLAARTSLTGTAGLARSLPDLLQWPFRCESVCNGTVEVYRRTCCCLPWILDDWRLPELIRDLEDLVRGVPEFPPQPPNPPDPAPWFKDGALDERALYATRDLAMLRTLPRQEIAAYINARPYLLCRRYSCSTPEKVAEGFLNPDGRFNLCWLEPWRFLAANCHEEVAYVVKQTRGAFTFTIYNGVAANQWFAPQADASLVSHHFLAYGCRHNGAPGEGAFVYLDVIGDTSSHHLNTPAATGWDRVATPVANSGLVFPSGTPQGLNRNWGGTLKLNYKFSEDLRALGAKYYRLSVSAADASGNPVGTRHYLSAGLSWEKTVATTTGFEVVPVVLGPFPAGGQEALYLIPYDADAEWNANQYHALLDTTDARWSDPTVRHLVTLEIFDAAGKRLRPQGTAAIDMPPAEGTAAFSFLRRATETSLTTVPQAALTHLFWWDNRAVTAAIEDLRLNGQDFNGECQFLEGAATATFGIGYRAYHPNELFQQGHSISWQRGLNGASGTLLGSSQQNKGVPPAAPEPSPTNTFAEMLGPTLTKCAFTVFLSITAKTTDGEDLGYHGITKSAAFALAIN